MAVHKSKEFKSWDSIGIATDAGGGTIHTLSETWEVPAGNTDKNLRSSILKIAKGGLLLDAAVAASTTLSSGNVSLKIGTSFENLNHTAATLSSFTGTASSFPASLLGSDGSSYFGQAYSIGGVSQDFYYGLDFSVAPASTVIALQVSYIEGLDK